jgi:hypothetical protein
MIRHTGLCLLAVIIASASSFAQDISFSAPQKITAGYEKVEILGKNSQGILVRQIGRNDDEIAVYYDNMQLRWKKATPRKDKTAKLEEIVMCGDSLLFFYTEVVKGSALLKAFKSNSKLESLPLAITCDTINRSLVNTTPVVNFVTSTDKSKVLVYYEDPAFRTTDIIHLLCFDSHLRLVWKGVFKVKQMDSPVTVAALVDGQGNGCIAVGENTIKNFNNEFPYTSLHLFSVRQNGLRVTEKVFGEKNMILSECLIRQNIDSGNVILAGLYASTPGAESEGSYCFSFQPLKDSVMFSKLEPHSAEFLAQLTGNNPPKRNDGFFDFQPRDLVVKRDGGAILVTESISISSESYANNNYGAFGMSSGFTVNYYHYDDLAVFSFGPDGNLDWKQILHKKQSTEGDGGFYSSFIMVIAPSALHFVFNDVANGQTSVVSYSLSIDGKQVRSDLFNADRKGVMVIPRSSRQVSPTEVLMPSIKRNYLQFAKIGF